MSGSLPKKRLTFAVLTLFLLIVSWLWWAHIAKNRLQAKIDELEARHEPVYSTDVDLSPIPNNENAAFFYLSAAAAQSTIAWSPDEGNIIYPDFPPYPAGWYQTEDQAYVANQKEFSIARQARNLNFADWGNRPASPLSAGINTNYFNRMRSLANELADATLYAHLHDNDAEAIQYIFDLLHLSDMVGQRGFLIGRLVALGIRSLAIDRIAVIAVDLQVRDHSNSPNAADRADVIKLIHQLLDEQSQIEQRHQALAFERLLLLDDFFSVRERSTVLRPLVNLWIVRGLAETDRLQKAAALPNRPAAFALLSGSPNNSRFRDIEFRMTARYRLTAVSLALRLYQLDRGNYPDDLKSLVGEYLPAIPDDPFYATPQPIGYLPPSKTGVIRPLLYFDSNGSPSTLPPPTSPAFGWTNATTRQWLDISPWWIAAAPPTTKPTTR